MRYIISSGSTLYRDPKPPQLCFHCKGAVALRWAEFVLLTLPWRLSPATLWRKLISTPCVQTSLFRSLPEAHDWRWRSERRSTGKSRAFLSWAIHCWLQSPGHYSTLKLNLTVDCCEYLHIISNFSFSFSKMLPPLSKYSGFIQRLDMNLFTQFYRHNSSSL